MLSLLQKYVLRTSDFEGNRKILNKKKYVVFAHETVQRLNTIIQYQALAYNSKH